MILVGEERSPYYSTLAIIAPKKNLVIIAKFMHYI